jgi:glycosyltransferase involved in cell wall biosynthesis
VKLVRQYRWAGDNGYLVNGHPPRASALADGLVAAFTRPAELEFMRRGAARIAARCRCRATSTGLTRSLRTPPERMRILLVGDYPQDPRLGSTKVLVKLQEEFRALGHACDLLLADGLGRRPANARIRQALGPVLALSAIRRMFRERGPYDVVDIASAEGLWVGVLRRLGWFRGTVVIARSNGLEQLNYQRMLEDHDAGLLRKPWTRRWYYPAVRLTQVAAAARVADRLILLNDRDLAFALDRRWKPSSRIDVVPHGVSGSFLAGAPTSNQMRGKGLLFCGTWVTMKGVTDLVAAFERLVAAGTTVNLTVLGGGVPRVLIESAFTPAARQYLSVVDRADEQEVMAAYRSHDVLAFPSTYEGFGMVLLEAMTQRLPVVATPAGCATRLVVHEETGLVVPPRNPEALAAALTRMLRNPGLRARLADAAFARVRDMSWTKTAKATLVVYEEALRTARAA